MHHFLQLLDVDFLDVLLARGPGPITDADRTADDLDQALGQLEIDAFMVLHRGKVVQERYAGVMRPNGIHNCMSVTKSFVGLLALKAV